MAGHSSNPSGYTIVLADHASEPLLDYFERITGGGRPIEIKPTFAYWVDLDLELTTGRVIANPLEADVPVSREPDTAGVGPPRRARRTDEIDF